MWPVETPPGANPPRPWSGKVAGRSRRTASARAVSPEPLSVAAPSSGSSPSRQLNAAGELPVSAEARARASASWSAYASGNPERWTSWAATVISQLLVAVDLLQRVVEGVGRVHRVADLLVLPQPCEGRCWNSPAESRSPPRRLRRSDSWYAAARAIEAARAGIPRADGDRGDQPGVPRLRRVEHHGVVADLGACTGRTSKERQRRCRRSRPSRRRAGERPARRTRTPPDECRGSPGSAVSSRGPTGGTGCWGSPSPSWCWA